MRTEPKRKALALTALLTVLAVLVAVWYLHSSSQSSRELKELRDLGENVTSAINARDFARLEDIIGNPVAVETIRHDVGSGNEPVRLGQVHASNQDTDYLTIITSDTPEEEIFIYLIKEKSGTWRGYVP
ncbi:hypothetical protein J2S45_000663 [Trueperella abortisuis]|uniref:DUF4878 domain-containing protein n=1 Tax=Trueperella abortisuis TaxID=445930 RepID=A0ABT9PH00_9ACTO|nr:hypothetical protein [Trueperella abortisuis]